MTDVMARPSLLERARAELAAEEAAEQAEQERKNAEFRHRNVERLRTLLTDRLGIDLPEDWPVRWEHIEQYDYEGYGTNTETPVVEVEGILFTLAWAYSNCNPAVAAPCPKCGDIIVVREVSYLADVARGVDDPKIHQRCRIHDGKRAGAAPPIAPTVEQRLLSALKDLIAQEVPNGEG